MKHIACFRRPELLHILRVGAVASVLMFVTTPVRGADDETKPAAEAILHFPTPFRLHQVWTYDGALSLNHSPSVACFAGESDDAYTGSRLAIVHGSMLSSEGLLSLLTSGIQPDDERLLYEGPAPSRN